MSADVRIQQDAEDTITLSCGGPFEGMSLTIKVLKGGGLEISASELICRRDPFGGPIDAAVSHTFGPVAMTLDELIARL